MFREVSNITKVAIMVDNMYLMNAAMAFNIGHIDIEKLPNLLLDKANGEIHQITHIFDALPYFPEDDTATDYQKSKREAKKGYFEKLQHTDRVRLYEGVCRPKFAECPLCKHQFHVSVQKQVDVKISVQLLHLSLGKIVDKVVLIAGDADLVPAVEVAVESGSMVKLCYFSIGRVQTADALIRACTERRELSGHELGICKLKR